MIGNRTLPQDAETLKPLSVKIGALIPEYIGLAFTSRSATNQIGYSIYRFVRLICGPVWLTYAPLLAFIVILTTPSFTIKKKKQSTDGSSMDEDYQLWLQE